MSRFPGDSIQSESFVEFAHTEVLARTSRIRAQTEVDSVLRSPRDQNRSPSDQKKSQERAISSPREVDRIAVDKLTSE